MDDQGEIFALDVVIGDYMWVLKEKVITVDMIIDGVRKGQIVAVGVVIAAPSMLFGQ